MIRRKYSPGAGTWALPGGFKNAKETFTDCAIRELQEETNVRIPEKVLRGRISKVQMFDNPSRNYGIPRCSQVLLIEVQCNPDGSLPRANGADDASECKWIPINEVVNNVPMFDDHKDIIQVMTNVSARPFHKN